MINIQINGKGWGFKSFLFSGGELQIRIDDVELLPETGKCIVRADIRSSHDLMEMLLVVDALNEALGENVEIHVLCPYLPYARQDRICHPGEAFSLRLITSMIGDMIGNKINTFTVWDVHSKVAQELLPEIRNVSAARLLANVPMRENTWLIAPDKGARERVAAVSAFRGLPMIEAQKVRDPDTGQILRTEVPDIDRLPPNADIWMVDDICDGGRTFIELAKVLKPHTTGSIILYVTHGIFSQGFDVFKGLIDYIVTPNCFANRRPDDMVIEVDVEDGLFLENEE